MAIKVKYVFIKTLNGGTWGTKMKWTSEEEVDKDRILKEEDESGGYDRSGDKKKMEESINK